MIEQPRGKNECYGALKAFDDLTVVQSMSEQLFEFLKTVPVIATDRH